ncbi:TIR domain-containing protein [Haematococcus lacustris]
MTDPTEDVALAIWWERLKAAPADDVEKAKELCTSGDLKRLANKDLDAFITLLDTGGQLLPPPGDVAASLLRGLCKCAHEAHVDKPEFKNLRDRCLKLLGRILYLGHVGAFISTSRCSSALPKLPQAITNYMERFSRFLKEVTLYWNKCTREGVEHIFNRERLPSEQEQRYDKMTKMLRDLEEEAEMVELEARLGELTFVGEANSLELQAEPTEGTSCVAGCLHHNPPGPSNQALQGSPVQGGAQLFLSYRVPETGRKGDRTVLKLKSALEAQGYSVFVDESDIEGGASWVQAIDMAITDCQVFIPVCSETYGDTKWTVRELHAADEAKKKILPLWHSGNYPPKEVKLYLNNLQRLPRGDQPLEQANFQSLVSDLVAAIKKAGCLPRNPPGPSNQALQGLALDQRRTRI